MVVCVFRGVNLSECWLSSKDDDDGYDGDDDTVFLPVPAPSVKRNEYLN